MEAAMKQRKLNRIIIYLLLFLLIAAGTAIIICNIRKIDNADYIIGGAVILLGLLALRLFSATEVVYSGTR